MMFDCLDIMVQTIFNRTAALIEQVGEAEYAAEVVHAIHERAKTCGPAKALPSAIGSLVKAIPIGAMGQQAFDTIVATCMLGIALPIMLAASVAILLKYRGRGSIFSRQTCVGKKGRPFYLLRFRTRVQSRRTRGSVGQHSITYENAGMLGALLHWTSLRDIPMLINVMRGDLPLTSVIRRELPVMRG
jgi:lipopolysaccharide/colanic/teichoic acid biosynthesis glycosyltransferase